ncbi:MAG: glycosyltransferase [Lentisphaeria bacterium]|nr:MAG: glycosyltransferase [Lentisphaeria bacterium]
MKIVFLISCIKDGGAEHVMSRLVNHWTEAGHEVAVGCFEPFCRENSQWILDSRIRLLKLWELPKGRIAYRLSVRRMLRELNPDVIISFLCGANIFAVTYGKLLGRYRVILSERGNPAQDTLTRGMQWKRKLLFRLADRFVCQTRQAEEFCIPYYHLDRGRCTVIPNPPPIPPQRPETAPRLLPKKGDRRRRTPDVAQRDSTI